MILKVSTLWILGLFVGLYQRSKAWSWKEDKKRVVWFTVQVTLSVLFIHLSHMWSRTVPRTRYRWRCCLLEEMYSPALTCMNQQNDEGIKGSNLGNLLITKQPWGSAQAWQDLPSLTLLNRKIGERRRWKGFVRKMNKQLNPDKTTFLRLLCLMSAVSLYFDI